MARTILLFHTISVRPSKQPQIMEYTWRHSLTVLGMSRGQQDKIILKCMRATIEGTHSVLLAEENATHTSAVT